MIVKQCFALKIHDGDAQVVDYEIGENQNGQIAIRVGRVEITEEDLLKLFGRTQVSLMGFVQTISSLPATADAGQIAIVKYGEGADPQEINQPYIYTEESGWVQFGASAEEIDALQDEIDAVNKRIDELPKGIVYRGAVDYKKDLPADADKGDAYTVRYKGEEGTEPLGSEFVQVGDKGANDWVEIGPDLRELEERMIAAEADIDALQVEKLNKLPNVDDPSDPGYGQPYHFPYDAQFTADADKISLELKTITLDNNETKMSFTKEVPGATESTAGLMSAADKVIVNGIEGKVEAEKNRAETAEANLDSAKLDKLPNVDDPTDPGYGYPYWFPYDATITPDAEKIDLKLKTISLNGNLQKMTFDKVVPAATEVTAGLMTAADKIALAGKQDKLSAGDGIDVDSLSSNIVKLDLSNVIINGGKANT